MLKNSKPIEFDKARVREEVLAGSGHSLTQAARKLPTARNCAPVNTATKRRWVVKCIRLADGRRLRLEACRVSGRWLTSAEALARFIDEQTPDLNAEPLQMDRKAKARESAAARAGRELEAAGA
jgi:hypothetical protein